MSDTGCLTPASGRRRVVVAAHRLDPPHPRIAEFVSAAQRSKVTVFGINASGLPGAPATQVPGDAAFRWATLQKAMLNSLRALSEPTGGYAVLDDRDLAGAFWAINRWVR